MESGEVGVGTGVMSGVVGVGSGVATGAMSGVLGVGTEEIGVGSWMWMWTGDTEVAGERGTEEVTSGEEFEEQPGDSSKVDFIRGMTSLLILMREGLL